MLTRQDAKLWQVKGQLVGKPKANLVGHCHSADVSGIACAPADGYPRICLVADDETQGVQIVVLPREGQLVGGDFIRLIYDTCDGELLELDAEGVAYADDGYFYVTGSHGRPRRRDNGGDEAKVKARAKAAGYVFRVGFDLNAIDKRGRLSGPVELRHSAGLSAFISGNPLLRAAKQRPLRKNGVTIEGMDVRGDRIYFGFRSPLLDREAAILSLPLPALFDKAQGTATLHCVDLDKRGVRDLAVLDSGFLILAGPSQDPPGRGEVEPGDYKIFHWDGVAKRPTELLHPDLTFGNGVKPEALLALERSDNKLRVLVFCDGAKKGGPRSIDVEFP